MLLQALETHRSFLQLHTWRVIMKAEVFKTIQITGSSTSGSDEAITAAVEKAAETVRNLRWFKVTETRGHIENGKIAHWQVTIDLGFTLD